MPKGDGKGGGLFGTGKCGVEVRAFGVSLYQSAKAAECARNDKLADEKLDNARRADENATDLAQTYIRNNATSDTPAEGILNNLVSTVGGVACGFLGCSPPSAGAADLTPILVGGAGIAAIVLVATLVNSNSGRSRRAA